MNLPPQSTRYLLGPYNKARKYLQNVNQYPGLLFELYGGHGEDGEDEYETFCRLTRHPAVTNLFERPLFGFTVSDGEGNTALLIANEPKGMPPLTLLCKRPNEYLFIETHTSTLRIRIASIYNACRRAEKISFGCEYCRLCATDFTSTVCIVSALTQWLEKNGYHGWDVSPRYPKIECLERSDEHHIAFQNCLGYSYAKPCHTCEDIKDIPREMEKKPWLRKASGHYFCSVEDNKEAASDRSKEAARTRKRFKVCDTQCYFSKTCDWRTGKCGWSIKRCLEPADLDVPGPFTKEQVLACYRYRIKKHFAGRMSDEELGYVLGWAGIETRIFGHALEITGPSDDLRFVRFAHPTSYQRARYFTFQDTIAILRTPWIRRDYNGNAHYDRTYPPHTAEPIDEETLFKVAETLRHSELAESRGGWGGWSRTPVTGLKWASWTKTLLVRTDYTPREYSSLRDGVQLFGSYTVISALKSELSMDQVAAAHQVSR